jgi:hypothetical protein
VVQGLFPMWREFLRSSNVSGIDGILGLSSKRNTALWDSLMFTRPLRNPQIMAHLVCSVLCDCRESYVCAIGWPLGMRLRENGHNWKERLLQRLERAEHSDRSHRTSWNESRVLKVEMNLLKPSSCFMYKIVFNVNNSEFRHRLNFCFLLISEQIAVISL